MAEEQIKTSYPDSPREFDVKAICDNPDFGSLKFSEVEKILDEMVRTIVELEDDDYKANLKNAGSILRIDTAKRELNNLLKRIQLFDIKQQNNENIQREIIGNVQRFFQNDFYNYVEGPLATLRYEKLAAAIDLNEIVKGRKKLEKLLSQTEGDKLALQSQLDDIKKEKEDVQSGRLSLGTTGLSIDFDAQYNIHKNNAVLWFRLSVAFYALIVMFIVYKLFFDQSWSNVNLANLNGYISFVLDLILISSIFYGLSFLRKNYNIERNLELRNRNRRTLASTLDRFLVSGTDIEFKKDMIAKAVPAIFTVDKTGYLDKDENNINPTHEVISNVVRSNSGGAKQ